MFISGPHSLLLNIFGKAMITRDLSHSYDYFFLNLILFIIIISNVWRAADMFSRMHRPSPQ